MKKPAARAAKRKATAPAPAGKVSRGKGKARVAVTAKPRITPFFMFNANPEEAARFYVSIFKNSTLLSSNPMQATFILDGQKFLSFNGGPRFSFSEGLSLFVRCETQKEVDYYWNKLTAAGGAESMCGWLKDKYGVSWQIVPTALMDLMGHEDRGKANRAMQAMLRMRKIDIQGLKDAAAGK